MPGSHSETLKCTDSSFHPETPKSFQTLNPETLKAQIQQQNADQQLKSVDLRQHCSL